MIDFILYLFENSVKLIEVSDYIFQVTKVKESHTFNGEHFIAYTHFAGFNNTSEIHVMGSEGESCILVRIFEKTLKFSMA